MVFSFVVTGCNPAALWPFDKRQSHGYPIFGMTVGANPGDTPTGETGPWASLHSNDAYRLIDFLVNGFGFVPTVVVGNESVVHHVE